MSSPSGVSTQVNLRCFGVGDGWPCTDRRHSSFLYRFGDTTVLIDCGDGLSSAYKASGLPYDAVDALLLSHLHSDHVGGLSMFLQGLWLERRKKPLAIHAPAGAIPKLQAWLEATLISPELLGFSIEWRRLEAGRPLKVGEVTVTPHLTSHLDSLKLALQKQHPTMCFEAFSFILEGSGRRVAHTADIGAVADLDPLLAAPVDMLVSELAHVELQPLLARLRGSAVGRLILVHLGREHWDDISGTEAAIHREQVGMPFVIARDGDEFPL